MIKRREKISERQTSFEKRVEIDGQSMVIGGGFRLDGVWENDTHGPISYSTGDWPHDADLGLVRGMADRALDKAKSRARFKWWSLKAWLIHWSDRYETA